MSGTFLNLLPIKISDWSDWFCFSAASQDLSDKPIYIYISHLHSQINFISDLRFATSAANSIFYMDKKDTDF